MTRYRLCAESTGELLAWTYSFARAWGMFCGLRSRGCPVTLEFDHANPPA